MKIKKKKRDLKEKKYKIYEVEIMLSYYAVHLCSLLKGEARSAFLIGYLY